MCFAFRGFLQSMSVVQVSTTWVGYMDGRFLGKAIVLGLRHSLESISRGRAYYRGPKRTPYTFSKQDFSGIPRTAALIPQAQQSYASPLGIKRLEMENNLLKILTVVNPTVEDLSSDKKDRSLIRQDFAVNANNLT